ncbi:N-lysine methyltransferase setd6 [Chlorella vulgaris]
MPPQVLTAFQAWMESVGIEHNRNAIRLVDAAAGCSGLALGVQAVRDVAEGERLCTIPKAACISIRTTELADVIEAEELGGGLGLVLAVMHERSLGPQSKWHGYFASLPPREYLPIFWDPKQLLLLRGTELEQVVANDRHASQAEGHCVHCLLRGMGSPSADAATAAAIEAAREDFEEHVLPLLAKYPGRLRKKACTLSNFQIAAAFVASRAFGIDEWHGDAMVPLADIFNHKASVVELGAGYQVHGAQSDEEEGDSGSESQEGGSEQQAGSEEDEEEEEEQAGASSSHSSDNAGSARNVAQQTSRGAAGGDGNQQQHAGAQGGQPQGAGRNGSDDTLPSVTGTAAAAIYGLTSANGLHLRLEMGIVDRDEETLEIVAGSAVPGGAEVHNTYGELGNAELVKKYGFALRQNPFTSVTINKPKLLAAARAALGAARWRRRSSLLLRDTSVLEEDEEPFEALPNGHISPALFVALRVLCAPEAEAAAWSCIEDGLQLPSLTEAASCDDLLEGTLQGRDSELGAVQVWRVLGSDGQQLEAQPEAAVAAAGSSEQQQQLGYSACLNAEMCKLVQQAVQQRQEAYSNTLEHDLQQLQERQQGASGNADAAGEQHVAESAALLLRITEKEVLRDLQNALERKLAALAVAAVQEEPQQHGGKQGKRKAAAGKQPSGGTKRQAAAGDASGAAASDGPEAGGSSPGKAPRVVSIPAGLPTAGAVFFLAGALKVIIMCFPYSEMAIMMFLQGRADLGLTAALKAIPIALGIAALAKAIVDRELQGRRWVQVAIVTGAIGALCLSRFFFARPRPSPLDPMIRQAVAERANGAAEQQRAAATQRRHLLQQPDAEVGRTMMRQQQEQAEAAGKGR